MSLTTRSAVKQWLGIATSDTTYDNMIDRLILVADDEIGRFCDRLPTGYSFDSGTYTELFDGLEADRVVLHNNPITSITSVTITDGQNETTVDDEVYTFEVGSGVLAFRDAVSFRWETGYDYPVSPHGHRFNRPGFPKGFQNIEVVYVGGYSSIPASLAQVAIDQITRRFRSRARDYTLRREKLGAYEYEVADIQASEGIDEDLQDRLRRFGFARGALV